MILIPHPGPRLSRLIFSELGVIELGTAVFYFAAAALVLKLFFELKSHPMGNRRRLCIAMAAVFLFIALEEINYGQFFFDFSTPDTLATHNSKREFNLHNLFKNTPARRLNLIATIGFLTGFVILPFAFPEEKRNGIFVFLPKRDLILFAVIAQLLSWLDDVCGWMGISNPWIRATEFKEFYWSLMVLLWTVELRKHLPQSVEGRLEHSVKKPIPTEIANEP